MRRLPRLFALLISVGLVGTIGMAQTPDQGQDPPEGFSPLGYMAGRMYEQAYPAEPHDPAVRQAAAAKFGAFQQIQFRGFRRGVEGLWSTLGPETYYRSNDRNFTGRVTTLAISPTCQLQGRCRLWVGTAGGGVWRTDQAMLTNELGWRWIGHGLGTNSIGSLAVDPNDPSGDTIYVGTGEANFGNTSGAGTGLYRSTNGGDSWTRVPTMILDPVVSATPIDFTLTRGIGTVVVEPGDPQTLYVATTIALLGMTGVRGGQVQETGYPQGQPALYRTTDGGASWALHWVPPQGPTVPDSPYLTPGATDAMIGVRDVKLHPLDSSMVYVAAFNNGIYRSAPSLEGGDASFKQVFATVGADGLRDLVMFDIAMLPGGATRLYAYNGTGNTFNQRLYRLDDAGVPAANLVAGGANTAAWMELSSDDDQQPGWTSWRMCGGQCFYDLVVASSPGQPDTVYVGGVQLPVWREPTIRSVDAGVTFNAFGRDAQDPRRISHVDVRAIVFHPENPDIVYVGSDGGVVRNDGVFVDISDRCPVPVTTACLHVRSSAPQNLYFLNKGLQALQFYNVALDPQAPLRRQLGGLQDNGTIWNDGTQGAKVWSELFPRGDGTSASGFHPTRSEVLFASFQSNSFFTNFRNGDVDYWTRTDSPIRLAGERASIVAASGRQFITFDAVSPDTQFTGFQHIWRTQNNGGDQAFLEANCRGGFNSACGDWVPLGVAYPFPVGSNPGDAIRQPGDLTSAWEGDREGGIIVAAARPPASADVLWAATSTGRLFISQNAQDSAPDVMFTRLDTPSTPGRFISSIVVDRTDPHVAYVSYSGFNALTPATPGHVFRVVYNPGTGMASFANLDHDLGDMPINTLAYDDVIGDLYAGTDYGVLVLPAGSVNWEVAGTGFPEALTVDLEIVPDERFLVAATHGLGIFSLNLPKAK